MENIEGYDVAPRTERAIDKAHKSGKEVVYIVLTCPDYPSEDGAYVFKNSQGLYTLNEGVPLLVDEHISSIECALTDIDRVAVLIADIEAHNPYLVKLYTDGDSDEYQRRCDASSDAIKKFLKERLPRNRSESSSFLQYFEDGISPFINGRFVDVREMYYEELLMKLGVEKAFEREIINAVNSYHNTGFFKREYGGLPTVEEEVLQVLTTMAEYLTLGYLIAKKAYEEDFLPVIVSYSSPKVGLFNKVGINNGYRPEGLDDLIDYPRTPTILRKARTY